MFKAAKTPHNQPGHEGRQDQLAVLVVNTNDSASRIIHATRRIRFLFRMSLSSFLLVACGSARRDLSHLVDLFTKATLTKLTSAFRIPERSGYER